jgi:hypothetical protein
VVFASFLFMQREVRNLVEVSVYYLRPAGVNLAERFASQPRYLPRFLK